MWADYMHGMPHTVEVSVPATIHPVCGHANPTSSALPPPQHHSTAQPQIEIFIQQDGIISSLRVSLKVYKQSFRRVPLQ